MNKLNKLKNGFWLKTGFMNNQTIVSLSLKWKYEKTIVSMNLKKSKC